MSHLNEKAVLAALSRVKLADGKSDIVAANRISGVSVRGGKIGFLIAANPADREGSETLRRACEQAVRVLDGVESVTAVLTAEQPMAKQESKGERATWNRTPLDHVRYVVAVASGKGGVGKSTVTVNLAQAFQQCGWRAGILDADIYGPSIPRMMGLLSEGQPPVVDGQMIPPESQGIPCMSMGFIIGDAAAVMRGPMITKALQQMLRLTRWGTAKQPLDVLLVDMPPGTGDIHLSMVQQAPVNGAVIVTTPQEVALMDARKAAEMFTKVDVKLLGVMENMSGPIFGSGGGRKLAQECRTQLLAELPLEAPLREAGDSGKAYVKEGGALAEQFIAAARSLVHVLPADLHVRVAGN